MRDAAGPDVHEVRTALRRAALAARDAIPEAVRREASDRIGAETLSALESSGARKVHCYLNIRSEVETRTLIEELLARGLRVVVPAVEGDASKRALVHSEIHGLTNLRRGAFGIDEPQERSPSALESLDAVIIPMVAFDRRGTRLGYGKGFYDVFLRQLPREVRRIGLAFSLQEVAHIPALPHDERMGSIITEIEQITANISSPKSSESSQ